LRGEKIDIVTWNPDAAKFICNALAPAEIIRVIVDEGNHSMEVVVADDQLSLAIGRRGQNVRLASRLTGWNLDVIGETNYNQTLKEGYKSLLQLEGVGEKRASDLFEYGFRAAEDVAQASVDELASIKGISEERAATLIQDAIRHTGEEALGTDAEEEPELDAPPVQADDETVSEEVPHGES
jgi:N utilization substance protein A